MLMMQAQSIENTCERIAKHFVMKRNYSISALRLFALALIVSCHVCQFYESAWAWYLNVGVDLFLLVSGYLYGVRDIEHFPTFMWRRILKIGVPFCVIVIAFYGALWVRGEPFTSLAIARSLFGVSFPKGLGHLWFVPCILICYLLLPYFQILKAHILALPSVKMWSWVIVLASVTVFIGVRSRWRIWNPEWLLCFFAGYFWPNVKSKLTPSACRAIVWVLMTMGGIALVLRLVMGWASAEDVRHVPYLKFLLAFGIFLPFIEYKFVADNAVLDLSDRYSYEIYLTHQIFLLGPFSLLPKWGACVCIVLSSVMLKFISEKASLKLKAVKI